MYLHAYQSYLWNAAASHRVSSFPHDRPVAGDLVLLPSGPAQGQGGRAAAAAAEGGGGAEEEGGENEGAEAAAAEGGAGGGSGPGSVHVVTEGEAAAGAFRMEDVVLPLPGYAIEYPRHASAQVGGKAGLGGRRAGGEGMPQEGGGGCSKVGRLLGTGRRCV